jgi:indolepyruvate ferredoxin oxidoreductase
VANVASTPTADFTRNADWKFPLGGMEAAIADAVGAENAWFVDATRLATGLLGDTIATNMFMLGYAYQKGLIPVSSVAIDRAIELNEVAVEQNRSAFLWGRRAAIAPERVAEVAAPPKMVPVSRKLSESLDELIARRVDFLTAYQDEAYARRYLALVEKVRAAEGGLPVARPGDAAAQGSLPSMAATAALASLPLTEAVARYLFKLMAYKDEYEVARLYTSGQFAERLSEAFDGEHRLKFHLAPPLFAKRNERGELVKREYGPWVFTAFRMLARLRGLRGTAFDPFGRTEERRAERELIREYEATIGSLLERLSPQNRALAVEIASVPEQIRGFGHVKAKSMGTARQAREQLLRRLDQAEKGVTQAVPA